MKWTFYYYFSKTIDNMLGFPVLTLHFQLFHSLRFYMCIPLRIDQGLSVWYPFGIGWSPISYFDRLLHFSPFPWPLLEGVCHWRSQKQSKSNTNSFWGGLWGRWCKEGKAVWAFSFAHWRWEHLLWAGTITQGNFCTSPGLSPGWKAAGCCNTGFPVCRKQVWFLLSVWLYSHLNSNQHFLKLGARQGLLCFLLGNPWGCWGDHAGCHHCWPGSGSMEHCHGTLWGPPGHLGSLPGPCGSDILPDWLIHHSFCPDEIPIRKKKEASKFNSLVALQVLKKMEILLVLLLKPKLLEQFQNALLGAPLVPPMKDLGRAPMVSYLEEEGNSSQKIYSHCSCAKADVSPGLSLSPFCEQLFHTGKKREQRQITISARNVSNTFPPWVTEAASWVFAEGREKQNTEQDQEGQNLLGWKQIQTFHVVNLEEGTQSPPSFPTTHTHKTTWSL